MPTDFRERGREGKETSMRERNIRGLPLSHAPTRGQTCNLGMCPEWESNSWPFGLWEDAPTNWAILARAKFNIFKNSKKIHLLISEREGGERERFRQRDRERNTDVRGKHQLVVFLYVPLLGVESTTWVLALTGNRTCNLSVYGMMLQPTEPYWPGCLWVFFHLNN